MPLYKYVALTQDGERITGTFEADTKTEIINMLRQNKQHPVKIEASSHSNNLQFSEMFEPKVKTKDLTILCRQMAVMLRAGVNILACLDTLRKQTENKKLKYAMDKVYDDVQKGITLSQSFNKYPDVFPELTVNMVAAGEASGDLDTIMERLSDHYEKENKIENKVKNAMVYPIILSLLCVCVVIFVLTFIMPIFVKMFEDSGTELPGLTVLMMKASKSIGAYWYVYLTVVIIGTFSLKKILKTQRSIRFMDRLKLTIPGLRTTQRKIIVARFTRTLSTLLASGMSLLSAIDVVIRIIGNTVIVDAVKVAKDDLRKGTTLSDALRKNKNFPPMVINMIAIGEDAGSLDAMLLSTANYYDEEVEASLTKMVSLLEPMMIIVMALVVGTLVIAMVLPMFGMMATVPLD